MPVVEWKSKLETGIPFVDGDHQVLASLINQIIDTVGDREEEATLLSAINALVDCAEYHFAREERLQQAVHSPGLAAHAAAHRRMAEEIRQLRDRYLSDHDSLREPGAALFLKSWLLDHVVNYDLAFCATALSYPELWHVADLVSFGDPEDQQEGGSPGLEWESLDVLLVDDNRNFLFMLGTLVKSLGAGDVRMAESGAAGLALLKERPADLIVCDWRMEGMDGLAFVRALRSEGHATSVIMLSGYGEDGFRERALAAGVNDFLEKPITARGLADAATGLLAAR